MAQLSRLLSRFVPYNTANILTVKSTTFRVEIFPVPIGRLITVQSTAMLFPVVFLEKNHIIQTVHTLKPV